MKPWKRPTGCECDESSPAKFRCTAQWMRCNARLAYAMRPSESEDGMKDAEIREALVAFVRASATGAPYTWRNSNKMHRRMLEAERRGLVEAAKRTRAQIFWRMTDAGDRLLRGGRRESDHEDGYAG